MMSAWVVFHFRTRSQDQLGKEMRLKKQGRVRRPVLSFLSIRSRCPGLGRVKPLYRSNNLVNSLIDRTPGNSFSNIFFFSGSSRKEVFSDSSASNVFRIRNNTFARL